MKTVVCLDHASIAHGDGAVVLNDICWRICEDETWAIVGTNGAGKTLLTDVLLGAHRLAGGVLTWPLIDRLRTAGRAIAWPKEIAWRVAFKEADWRFAHTRHYYQQRFNFIEPHDDLTLNEFLRADATDEQTVSAVCAKLDIESLRALSLIKLSNGQIRRARIARSLLAKPEFLILDEPFMGLDALGREEVAVLLGNLIEQGLRLLIVTRVDAIPTWVTHVLELDHGTVHWKGNRHEFRSVDIADEKGDPSPATMPSPASEPIIELRNVAVRYGNRDILHDVTWNVRTGEKWAVLGPNGAGKSTLLSLLCGDHPQAYSNDICLFGRKRGSGESIWDIKRRIGFVSPELHLYFSEPLTAAATAATGFHDVLAERPTTAAQQAIVRRLFEDFGVTVCANRLFTRLSTGEQRLILLIRALVKSPELLILDEPFQGLDDLLVRRARRWLEQRLRADQTLLFVSHYENEIPSNVTNRLRLSNGRIIESSRR